MQVPIDGEGAKHSKASHSKASRSGETGKRSRDPTDAEVAKRVRALRLQRGLSQTELSDALGVTFQQVQKYERGANRISAGRLFRIAKVLDVPVSFFFSDKGRRNDDREQAVAVDFDFLQTGGAMRLIRAYARIRDGGALVRLAECLAGE
jgi:transcriptional regulator with XRE-family HTH domain